MIRGAGRQEAGPTFRYCNLKFNHLVSPFLLQCLQMSETIHDPLAQTWATVTLDQRLKTLDSVFHKGNCRQRRQKKKAHAAKFDKMRWLLFFFYRCESVGEEMPQHSCFRLKVTTVFYHYDVLLYELRGEAKRY